MLNTDTLAALNATADASFEGGEVDHLIHEDALAQLTEAEFAAYLIARYGIED